MFFKKHWWAIIFSILLVAYTVYISLDTFVITRVYTTIPQTQNSTVEIKTKNTTEDTTYTNSDNEISKNSQNDNNYIEEQTIESSNAQETEDNNSTNNKVNAIDNSYNDDNISITIKEYDEYSTAIYVADIQVASPEYLKTAFADNAYGKNVTETTSNIASSVNAILAINGDYYGAQESGYVIRNGVIYRDKSKSGQKDLAIMNDGSFQIISENDISAQELLDNGATQVLSFGPSLIEKSQIAVIETEEVGKAMVSNPRTAIGIIDNCHYVFVVSDGRTNESAGLSLYQLAEFMQTLSVQTAYNLDGGGSSTMYFNGQIINNPTTNGEKIEERKVSDIVYIG